MQLSITDIRIAKRAADIDGNLRSSLERIKYKFKRKKISKEISNIIGKQIFDKLQVSQLAYLLGFTDPKRDYVPDEYTFNKDIEPLIPENGIVNLKDIENLEIKLMKSYSRTVYTLDSVEIAFQELDKQGKLEYSKTRFIEAIHYI